MHIDPQLDTLSRLVGEHLAAGLARGAVLERAVGEEHAAHRVCGLTNIDLTEKGIAQAKEAGRSLQDKGIKRIIISKISFYDCYHKITDNTCNTSNTNSSKNIYTTCGWSNSNQTSNSTCTHTNRCRLIITNPIDGHPYYCCCTCCNMGNKKRIGIKSTRC